MTLLAELVYMRRDLSIRPPEPQEASGRLEWKNYGQFTEKQLGGLILRTYVDSLDCPGLRGVREVSDVIDGHKHSGRFCPEAWWMACGPDGSEPRGCILVNDSAATRSADIIYMGVAPEFRRQGLARALLGRVIVQSAARRCDWISVAVDTRNTHALRVYQQCGFLEIQRRAAYVRIADR